jgi:hypothetical protein
MRIETVIVLIFVAKLKQFKCGILFGIFRKYKKYSSEKQNSKFLESAIKPPTKTYQVEKKKMWKGDFV